MAEEDEDMAGENEDLAEEDEYGIFVVSNYVLYKCNI